MGPEDEPDGAEAADEFDEPADAVEVPELPLESEDEGTPRLGPDEVAGLMPSAPIIVAGADWEEVEVVVFELPEAPSVGAAEAEGLDGCELP